MKLRKITALALAGLLATSAFAGCGNNGSSSSSAPSSSQTPSSSSAALSSSAAEPAENALQGKLTVSLWDLNTSAWSQPLADAFMAKYPGTQIEFIDTPSTEYTDKLSTMLNGGTDFDVFLIKDADTIVSINKKNQLEDLSAYIARDSINMSSFNGLDQYFATEGKQIAMPLRTDYYILYYNKDIFDAANEPYPSNDMTWAEFEEVAGRITAGTGAEKQYGGFLHTWQACVQNWAVQDGKNTIMGPDYSFMIPAYEMALRMQTAGTIPDYATLKSANIHYSSAFQTGTAGMMPMGTWFISTMIASVASGESTVNWGIATLPHPEGVEAGYTVGSTTPICINSASKNKDLAWEFIKFATGDEGAAVFASFGQFPAATNDAHIKIITNVDGIPEGTGAALEVKNISLDRPIVDFVSEVNQMLNEEHGLVMLGESTLEDFIKTITERSAEIQG